MWLSQCRVLTMCESIGTNFRSATSSSTIQSTVSIIHSVVSPEGAGFSKPWIGRWVWGLKLADAKCSSDSWWRVRADRWKFLEPSPPKAVFLLFALWHVLHNIKPLDVRNIHGNSRVHFSWKFNLAGSDTDVFVLLDAEDFFPFSPSDWDSVLVPCPSFLFLAAKPPWNPKDDKLCCWPVPSFCLRFAILIGADKNSRYFQFPLGFIFRITVSRVQSTRACKFA